MGLSDAAEALRKRLAAALNEERERGRLFLWLPVASVCGALLFFSAERDPAIFAPAVAFGVLCLVAFAARGRPAGFPVAMLLLALAAGFLSAALRVERVAAPILGKPMRGVVTGTVESIEPRSRGVRLEIAVESLSDLIVSERPMRVRVTVPRLNGAVAGDRISVEALWRPPPGPARPGGYDFARDAFFAGIGAVGAQARVPVVLARPELSFAARWTAGVDGLRNIITSRIVAAVPGDAGAIAAALVTGQRGQISKAASDALRVAGLYHVISISGLHMALFGGTLFAVLRLALALIPGFGLRHPIKKWAAVVALCGAAGYLAISGAEIAAQRSFIMIATVFLAVVFDRQGITMRNLALAAFAAVLLFPEAVLGPSFQMSFCAVMAIVAWYEHTSRRAPDETGAGKTGGVMRFAQIYFGGIVATTIAATVATAPFSTFHFQRMAVHSLPGNLIALPIVGLLVMPWALVGFLLIPFGLDFFAWRIMGFGIDLMLATSAWVASWPFATMSVPAFGGEATLLMAFGLCWLALWTTWLRRFGFVPFAAGIALAAASERADIYIEAGGRAAAVRGPGGRLSIIGVRFASFAAGTWLAADGDQRSARDKSVSANIRCDNLGCTALLPDGRALALSWTYAALNEDCARAAVVVTRLIAPPSCRATGHVIDGNDLARYGAVNLTLQPGGVFTTRTARGGAKRIWHGSSAEAEGPTFVVTSPGAAESGGAQFDLTDMED